MEKLTSSEIKYLIDSAKKNRENSQSLSEIPTQHYRAEHLAEVEMMNQLIPKLEEMHNEAINSNVITEQSKGVLIDGHFDTWYVIGKNTIDGKDYFLMENEKWGDEAAAVIVDEKGNPVMDDVYNGFLDLEEFLIDEDAKAHIDAHEAEYGADGWRAFGGTHGIVNQNNIPIDDFYRVFSTDVNGSATEYNVSKETLSDAKAYMDNQGAEYKIVPISQDEFENSPGGGLVNKGDYSIEQYCNEYTIYKNHSNSEIDTKEAVKTGFNPNEEPTNILSEYLKENQNIHTTEKPSINDRLKAAADKSKDITNKLPLSPTQVKDVML